ncbi:MAG: thioredoxin domain-containing protein [Bdellovibrionales bacterium]|nr:thioredoxin domain-containing protein [Oligoflexia bacterium]
MAHRLGPQSARIIIIEYLDYQCPYSAEAEEALRETLDSFKGEVALEVRHFPLGELHEWAGAAALTAEAAANQGKFWQMHYLLFQNQDELDMELMLGLAEEMGLNLNKFMADLQNPKTLDRVKLEIAQGEKQGVEKTPGIFVNGLKFEGEITPESLKEAIENALDASKAKK